jgi:hypothetical protein
MRGAMYSKSTEWIVAEQEFYGGGCGERKCLSFSGISRVSRRSAGVLPPLKRFSFATFADTFVASSAQTVVIFVTDKTRDPTHIFMFCGKNGTRTARITRKLST